MGASIEHQLICKVIELSDFHTVEKLKIDESFFLGDQNVMSQTREAFRFMRDHYHNEVTYGSVPSWQLLQQRFYGFPWVYSYDTLPALCQELRRNKMRSQIFSLTEELNQRADTDPSAALNTLREAASTLVSQHEISDDLLLSAAGEQLWYDYNMIAQGHGLIGIPWPWDILNQDTQGIQKSQFIVFYGRPKSMKTWMALYVACNAYLKGARVLIYSLEMRETLCMRRLAAILAQVEYEKFKNGKLDPATLNRVFGILYQLKEQEASKINSLGHQPALLAVHPRTESSGVSTLQAKIREFSPDLVIVDGMYLMRDDRQKARTIDWKAITHISQDLKRTASIFDIPIIGVTQANRGADKDPAKADLAELSYADALGQDCDLCMRVHKQKDAQTKEYEIVLSFPGSREGTLDGFVINGVPAVNFHFKRATIIDPNNPQPVQTAGGGGGPKASRQPAVMPMNWRQQP